MGCRGTGDAGSGRCGPGGYCGLPGGNGTFGAIGPAGDDGAVAAATMAQDAAQAIQERYFERTCVCEPGWIKTGIEWTEGEDLCLVPETMAIFLSGLLFALSLILLVILVPSTIYSMKIKLNKSASRSKLLRGLVVRLCLVMYPVVNATWSSVLLFAILDSKMIVQHEAEIVAQRITCLYFASSIPMSVVASTQCEKYYRFTFKEKTPRLMFSAIRSLYSLIFLGCVLAISTATGQEMLASGTQAGMVGQSLFYLLVCVLFQRCLMFLKRNVRETALNSNSKVQKKKLGTSIKQLEKLQVANLLPAGILITVGLLSAMIPVLFRVHYLSACCTIILVQSSMVIMQLDFFRRSYLKQKEKLARKLKELERRGLQLESKFAKLIKAYAPAQSNAVAPASVVPSSPAHWQESPLD